METASGYTSEFCTGDFLSLGNFSLFSEHSAVANYTNASGKVVFITRNRLYLAPNAIFLDNPNLVFPGTLTIEPDYIHCSTFQIQRNPYREYNSAYLFASGNESLFEARLFAVALENLEVFPKKSLIFTVFEHFKPEIQCGFDFTLVKSIKAATALIAEGKILQGVYSLKGLGHGTTPAGDDFIAGLLYGLHYLQQLHGFDKNNLIQEILEASKGSNVISNAMLEHAAGGRYFHSLKNFFLAIDQNQDTTLSLRELFLHGATSGADILSGFLFAIKHRITE